MEGQLDARVILADDGAGVATEVVLQRGAGLVILGELLRVGDRQLVQAADVPTAGEQQAGLGGDKCPEDELRIGIRVVELLGQTEGGLDGGIQEREEDFRLGREVVVQRGLANAHGFRDLVRRRRGEALRGEELSGCVEDLLARRAATAPRAIFTRPTYSTCHGGTPPSRKPLLLTRLHYPINK